MDRFVARVNVGHIRDKLATEQDEVKRQTLQRILAEQEAKLAELENNQAKKKRHAD
jgi:bacterioferritin (cytochrome b1)